MPRVLRADGRFVVAQDAVHEVYDVRVDMSFR
jgi:hypothetical protein